MPSPLCALYHVHPIQIGYQDDSQCFCIIKLSTITIIIMLLIKKANNEHTIMHVKKTSF